MKFRDRTLAEMLDRSVAAYAARPAFGMIGEPTLSYAQFGERVGRLRELLAGAGLAAGDKVALLASNHPHWAVSYLAIAAAGLVVVPILPDFAPEQLDAIVLHSDARALVVSDRLYGKLSEATLARMHLVVRCRNLAPIAQKVHRKSTLAAPRGSDIAAIIYTSGTTSAPKGVMLTHAGLCAQTEMVLSIQAVDERDVFLSILPPAHTYECSLGMLLPLRQGASVVCLDRAPTAASLLPALKSVRPTTMLSVPLIIEKLYKSQVVRRFEGNLFLRAIYRFPLTRRLIHRLAGRRLRALFGGRLRFFGIGGAKLDRAAERFLGEARFPYAIGYGLTETAPLLAGAGVGRTRLGSTGPAMRGVELRVEGIDPVTKQGQIVVKSPSQMVGYYKNPEAAAAVFTADGWLRTGDLGHLDKDGYLYITGRLGSMIVGAGGENVYPEEIESVLNSHSLVADSLVRQQRGQLVALVHFDREQLERKYRHLAQKGQYRLDEIKGELLAYVNSKVGKFARIAAVEEQREGFAKTPTLKIRRFLYKK